MTQHFPSLKHVLHLEVQVGEPLEIGRLDAGLRRFVPIVGGRMSGILTGRVLEGGGDFQLIRSATETELDARYILETDDGERIIIHSTGIRVASEEDTARLQRGEPVDPRSIYFRGTPRFETSATRLRHLMTHVFVSVGIRLPDVVSMDIFEVQ